jgi:hypothetical protein
LDEVVNEAVVVVDNEHPRRHAERLPASPMRLATSLG